MSQMAVFTFLRASDVPHLGFWSKPKPRLFRKPQSQFEEFLQHHALRQQSFADADGVYVAFVFARLDAQDRRFSHEADPVIETVRKNAQGSHWLLESSERRLLPLLDQPMVETDWSSFLQV